MQFNLRTLSLLLIGIALYLYLSDTLREQSFQDYLTHFFNKTVGNTTTHSLIPYIRNKTNTIAGFVSFTSIAILDSMPVNFKYDLIYNNIK